MPLWARCGVGDINSNDQDGGCLGEEKGIHDVREGNGRSGSTFEGLVRNVASILTDTVWGYFRPIQKSESSLLTELPPLEQTSGVSKVTSEPCLSETFSVTAVLETFPAESSETNIEVDSQEEVGKPQTNMLQDRNDKTEEGCNVETKSEERSYGIDEVLSSTLGALYGRATPAAVKQAWEVLSNNYHGDVDRFKSEFLNPVLELLHKVQEIQDTGEFPNSTWPLSVGSSVVVHLNRKNCRYLQDIGDFCINAVPGTSNSRPGIVVCDLTFDGIVERAIDEQEFGSLLTMDWARKVRDASDGELVFVLRQCMVASEYTVRHLRWDEIPHLDPRNLRSAPIHVGNSENDIQNEDLNRASLLKIRNSEITPTHEEYVHGTRFTQDGTVELRPSSQQYGRNNYIHLPDVTQADSSTDPMTSYQGLAVTRSLDDSGASPTKDQSFGNCSFAVNSHQLSHSHSFSLLPSPDISDIYNDNRHDSSIPVDILSGTQCNSIENDNHPDKISQQNCVTVVNSTHRCPPSSLPSSSSTVAPCKSLSASAPSASSLSGSDYYGTWHGHSKNSRSQKKTECASGSKDGSSATDVSGVCCQHRHIVSAPVGSQGGAAVESIGALQRSVGDHSHMEHSSSCNSLTYKKLEAPELVSQVDCEILNSGVAILPGCVDEDGRHLIFIFTCSIQWHERRVSSTALARLLMYYYTVPRKKSSVEGVAIVADIRGATPPTINVLLEALNLFQDNMPGCVAIIHVFADKCSQSYMIKSPLYDAKANVNLKVVLSFDHLQQYVNLSQIPTVLDGDYPYNHESWVRFRKKLEPFMISCRAVACRLVDTMQEISSSGHMPQNLAESSEMIRSHEQTIKLAFEDERLLTLQKDGPAIISALRREEESCAHSEDYSFAMEQATDLYRNLQDTIARLTRLADNHMTKLHNCMQLREYEDECHKVIDWLSQDGETILQKHSTTADNLKAVRHQQKDFEKFYYSAVSYIEKGNDLLEEASMLAQCATFSEATGYKDLAKTLRRQLQSFTGQLEDARERIEGTAKCYHLLDKSYEWALEAMKYVSSMKMEHSASAEGLEKLLRSLNIYLSEHPPIPEESFAAMLEAAEKLNNHKLMEQCKLAKARCQETHQLLQLRHSTLSRARNNLEADPALKEERGERPRSSLSSAHKTGQLLDRITKSAINNNKDLIQENHNHLSNLFLTPVSMKRNICSVNVESGDGIAQNSPLKPQDSSTPNLSNWQCAGDGHGVPINVWFKPKNSELNVSREDAPPFHCSSEPTDLCNKTSPDTSPSKISLLSTSSSPLPSSSSNYVPTSVLLPKSPTVSLAENQNRTRLYQPSSSISRVYNSPSTRISASTASGAAKSNFGRPISYPEHPSACTPPTRPHKKILKRACTAPVPMLTSPILEEEVGSFGHPPISPENISSGHEIVRSREQRNSKSISVITSSTESLPSMPEEEDADLDMSPSHEQHQNLSSSSSVKDWTPVPVNTHLHRSARGTPTGPMADLRLSEAEMKSRRTVSLIMSEMIQTERDYVRALQFITDHYVPELQRDDVPQMLRGKRTVIFGNLEKIHQFHSQYFLKQLETCQNQPFLVGQYFLQHETMFYLYALYNKNKPKSDCLMSEYGKEFFRQKQLELGDKMDLSSYLLKPVQRMGKYALLLKQLLKECAETELEYPELKASEEMVKFQLRHGNDLLAMDSLRDCDVNLQEQGRLLRQEEFLVFQGRKKSMRRIFLFEDLILFSKTRRGRQGQNDIYIYKTSFKTADIGLTENFGDSGCKFEIWFRRRSVGENYVLQAPSSEVKKAWVKDISRLLWRQAIRNRESRINELATMGIGNKPCLDIKPSEDNIQDRSINVSLANRGARTRNSIAVSSFDYLRNGNKRPHSIISVSSTSSSGSSQSSFGLLGSLNLAFDPLDSPRMNRRSLVSNESGIATDSDASGGDLGLENRGPNPSRPGQTNVPPLTAMRSYFDVMKSRVLKQKFSDQLFTDV